MIRMKDETVEDIVALELLDNRQEQCDGGSVCRELCSHFHPVRSSQEHVAVAVVVEDPSWSR